MNTPNENRLNATEARIQHRAFDVVVILKGLNGIAELAGGAALLFLTNAAILSWILFLTHPELSEDPRDFVANALVHWAQTFGQDSRIFVAGYLLFHGVAKITLAVLLLHGTKWAYPTAMVFFSFFVAYATYRLSFGWSIPLAVIIIIDLFTLWIIEREWRAHRQKSPKSIEV